MEHLVNFNLPRFLHCMETLMVHESRVWDFQEVFYNFTKGRTEMRIGVPTGWNKETYEAHYYTEPVGCKMNLFMSYCCQTVNQNIKRFPPCLLCDLYCTHFVHYNRYLIKWNATASYFPIYISQETLHIWSMFLFKWFTFNWIWTKRRNGVKTFVWTNLLIQTTERSFICCSCYS